MADSKQSKSAGKGDRKFDRKGAKPNFRKSHSSDSQFKGAKGSDKENAGKEGDKSHSQLRREKQKISEVIKKLRINYNKLLMKRKEFKQSEENKHSLVQESIDIIGDKFKDLIYKHDGCRIVQALIKHGNVKQKTHVLEQIKEHMVTLISQKYSKHLAQKAYFYAPTPQLKKFILTQINQQINKLIMHQYASEVVEYIYAQTENEKDRKEMVFAFYGQYFILFKDQLQGASAEEVKKLGLKQFLQKKPQLKG
mmetsp:Transcript_8408/g.14064  ORF Transcript_8408/g.14064 Transcript_8408/m.14064 type:complete len:252 (+) Transcript_8408:112-867(+)